MLPSECPNCGRLHTGGANFVTNPGPVQAQLANLARAAMRLVGAYEDLGYSDGHSDAVNSALQEAEEAGYLRFETVVNVTVPTRG